MNVSQWKKVLNWQWSLIIDSDQICQVAKVKAGPYLQRCDNISLETKVVSNAPWSKKSTITLTLQLQWKNPLAGAAQIKYIHVHISLGVAAAKARKSVSLMHIEVDVQPMNVSPEFGWNLIILQCHQRSKATFLLDSVVLKASRQWKADTTGNFEPPPYLQTSCYLDNMLLPRILMAELDTFAANQMRKLAEVSYPSRPNEFCEFLNSPNWLAGLYFDFPFSGWWPTSLDTSCFKRSSVHANREVSARSWGCFLHNPFIHKIGQKTTNFPGKWYTS